MKLFIGKYKWMHKIIHGTPRNSGNNGGQNYFWREIIYSYFLFFNIGLYIQRTWVQIRHQCQWGKIYNKIAIYTELMSQWSANYYNIWKTYAALQITLHHAEVQVAKFTVLVHIIARCSIMSHICEEPTLVNILQ